MSNRNIVERFKDISFFINDKEISGIDKERFINFMIPERRGVSKWIWRSKRATHLILNGNVSDLGLFILRRLLNLKKTERWSEINTKLNNIDDKEYNILIDRVLTQLFDKAELFKVVYKNNSLLIPIKDGSQIGWNLSFFINELPGYFAEYNLNEKDVVLDLGAYSGLFSIYASKIVGNSGKVIAFEPDRNNIVELKRNLKLNNSENVVVIKKGTWNKPGVVSFTEDGISGNICETGKTKIKVTSVDEELRRLKIPFKNIKFIKIDIEGAELETIDGMKDLLTNGNPYLAIASYHVRNGEKTYHEVEEKLKQFGYSVKTGYPTHLTTYAWKGAIPSSTNATQRQ